MVLQKPFLGPSPTDRETYPWSWSQLVEEPLHQIRTALALSQDLLTCLGTRIGQSMMSVFNCTYVTPCRWTNRYRDTLQPATATTTHQGLLGSGTSIAGVIDEIKSTRQERDKPVAIVITKPPETVSRTSVRRIDRRQRPSLGVRIPPLQQSTR